MMPIRRSIVHLDAQSTSFAVVMTVLDAGFKRAC